MNKFIIDPQFGEHGCGKLETCVSQCAAFHGKNARFFNGETVCAIINLNEFPCYNTFRNKVKKLYKGNVIRDARRSDNEGFYCKEFPYRLHIPDIHEIHTSIHVRQGKPMRESYLRSIEDMGGYPTEHFQVQKPYCPVHYQTNFGIFKKEDGHKQGEIVVNEMLLAYIGFLRRGNIAFYSMIIGHHNYLRFGIMYNLHFYVIKNLLNKPRNKIEYIIYAGMFQGTHGLQLFKKKAGFEGATLRLKDE